MKTYWNTERTTERTYRKADISKSIIIYKWINKDITQQRQNIIHKQGMA